jgi:uncharacterized membrane protein YbaN (DUF454 family)
MNALAWRIVAVVFLSLALIGLALPIVPQVPFLLVGAAAAAKGWPILDQRLRSHAIYGPVIRGWRERRAIPLHAKAFATVGLVGAFALAMLMQLPLLARLAAISVVSGTLLWIWTRPHE